MTAEYKPAFRTKTPQPNDSLIQGALGDTYPYFIETKCALEEDLSLELQWVYYRDGGWLCKCLKGKKNLAWICINENVSTLTCYFSARHREQLIELPLPPDLKAQISEVAMIGKMLPVQIGLKDASDTEAALTVVKFKSTAK